MDKRNKFWRREQQARVFKARMMLYAAYGHCIIGKDGCGDRHSHWFVLAREKWAQVYKTTGSPCSCWLCKGEAYNRREYKKDILRIVEEAEREGELQDNGKYADT